MKLGVISLLHLSDVFHIPVYTHFMLSTAGKRLTVHQTAAIKYREERQRS